jgi:hypothetical protein
MKMYFNKTTVKKPELGSICYVNQETRYAMELQ